MAVGGSRKSDLKSDFTYFFLLLFEIFRWFWPGRWKIVWGGWKKDLKCHFFIHIFFTFSFIIWNSQVILAGTLEDRWRRLEEKRRPRLTLQSILTNVPKTRSLCFKCISWTFQVYFLDFSSVFQHLFSHSSLSSPTCPKPSPCVLSVFLELFKCISTFILDLF